MADLIHIADLELSTHIGVPEEERAAPQRLTVSLTLEPRRDFRDLGDALENTVNYFTLTRDVQALARARMRRLVETLAQEIAEFVLAKYPVRAVDVELRKYILPDTAHVAIRLRRESP